MSGEPFLGWFDHMLCSLYIILKRLNVNFIIIIFSILKQWHFKELRVYPLAKNNSAKSVTCLWNSLVYQ